MTIFKRQIAIWSITLVAIAVYAANVQPVLGQNLTVLHTFTGSSGDGANPYAGVTLDSAGNLYGTTEAGGTSLLCPYGCGIAYKIDSQGHETILHNFGSSQTDGVNPYYGPLYRDAAGSLYGTTYAGGAGANGAVFSISPSDKETSLSLSGSKGGFPYAGLIADAAGNFYGTASLRGTGCVPLGCGVVFKIAKTGKETVLYNFQGGLDGANPEAPLVMDADGNLYGTTYSGGGSSQCTNGCGTVFKLSPTGKETVLQAFSGIDGGNPSYGPLVFDKAGNLYGTTYFGGAYASGTVYEISKSGSATTLYSFNPSTGDGWLPEGGLVIDSQGNLYGTTFEGGTGFSGTIFKVAPDGTETILYSFTGFADGGFPYSTLAKDSTGNLYGTTSQSYSSGNYGTVFKLSR